MPQTDRPTTRPGEGQGGHLLWQVGNLSFSNSGQLANRAANSVAKGSHTSTRDIEAGSLKAAPFWVLLQEELNT